MTTATRSRLTANQMAERMYATGEIGGDAQNERTVPKADIAIATVPATPPTVDNASGMRGAHDLPIPPDTRIPPWALEMISRDPAQAGLFPDDIERAEDFWRWLRTTRVSCAERAQNGYAYLASQRRPEAEDVSLYRGLLRWVSWCDTCLWLLTAWYAPHHAAPQPKGLIVPFSGLVNGDKEAMVVRELDGLGDRWLLEDALAWWQALALSTGYLEHLEDDTDTADEAA